MSSSEPKEMNTRKVFWEECERKPKSTTLGRRLSRRLSLVTKVPSIINSKLKQETSNEGFDSFADLKVFEVTVIAPDKSQRMIQCQKGQTILDAVTPIIDEFSLTDPKLYLAGSLATVAIEANIVFLYDNILIIENRNNSISDVYTKSKLHQLTEKIVNDESDYVRILNSAGELYDNPLVKISDDHEWNLTLIFRNLNNLSTGCNRFIDNLNVVLNSEKILPEAIGCCFNDTFWEEYNLYLQNYRKSKRLLRQRKVQDENFVQLCKLRQGAAKYSLEQIVDLPVSRCFYN